jgi:hypothetical protein
MNNKPFVFHTAFAANHEPEVGKKGSEQEVVFLQSYLFVNALFTAINYMTKEVESGVFHVGGAKSAEIVASCQFLAAIGLGFAEEMNIQFEGYREIMEVKPDEK